ERILPGDRPEPALALLAGTAKGLGQPRLRVEEDAVVPDRALAAELAAADGMFRVAADRTDGAVSQGDEHAAGVITVARARRAKDGVGHVHSQADSVARLRE